MLADLVNALSENRRRSATITGAWFTSPWWTDPTATQIRRCYTMLRAG